MKYGVRGAALVPHPPIMIPQVGGAEADKVSNTRQAMLDLASWMKTLRADVLLLISPHGPAERGRIPLVKAEKAAGDLSDFGAPQVSVSMPIDVGFVKKLNELALDAQLPVSLRKSPVRWPLDHGAVVPMYQLREHGVKLPLVFAGLPLTDRESLLEFGQLIDQAAQQQKKGVLVVASGDLSHRLSRSAPSGYHPKGPEFDQRLVEGLRGGNLAELSEMPEKLVQQAGQCGYNPMLVAVGAVNQYKTQSKVYSYEGPFGVGYAVAHVEVADDNPQDFAKNHGSEQSGWDPVSLARASLRHYLKHRQLMPVPDDICCDLRQQAGAFVTLKRYGQLRGCIGTAEPTSAALAEEIIRNAVSAGLRDPRFSPVTADELGQLTISVDVLSKPEEIESSEQLNPQKYGVIVEKGGSRGLLLPDLEGIETASEQIEVACRKAGLSSDEPGLKLWRFEVHRYQQ